MTKLLVYRLAVGIPLLVVVAVVVFSLFTLMPVDPAALILGTGSTPEARAELSHTLGLDRSYFTQLGDWLGSALSGDLGVSYYTQRSVSSMLLTALPVTLSLVFGGMVIAILLGLALGIASAVRPNSIVDRISTVFVSLFLAIPGFWLALILVLVFAVKIPLFPVAGYRPFSKSPGEWAIGLVLPCLSVGLYAAAVIARQTRSSLIDTLQSGYVRSLKARGVSSRRIVLRYGLKNALVPILAVIGMETSIAIGISFVVERVFSIPGMGTLLLDGVIRADLPLLEGAVLIVAALVLLINIAVDIGYGIVDPRVRPQ